jgi:hypothetical protein
VRALLQATQLRIEGKSKMIARHVPTRFAVLHLIGMDILKSEDSLKSMVSAVVLFVCRKVSATLFSLLVYTFCSMQSCLLPRSHCVHTPSLRLRC